MLTRPNLLAVFLFCRNLIYVYAGVFCYRCNGISSSQGSSCNLNSVCYGEACIMTMNTNGVWNSTCAKDGSSSLYDQLNGQQCTNGTIAGYAGTYATCACGTYFCNRHDLLREKIMTALNSQTRPVEPILTTNLTCFECGTVDAIQYTNGEAQVNVTCDGMRTCQGNFCLTRKSINPRSYCASPWMVNLTLGCTKKETEDELCVCDQSMCNYPYDPLKPVPTFATTTTTAFQTTTMRQSPITTLNQNNGGTAAPCVDGFRIVTGKAVPESAAKGKFGGYFSTPGNCAELCRRDYGLLPCIGYMVEPTNRGKCTIFQYAFDGYSTNPNSTTVIYERC